MSMSRNDPASPDQVADATFSTTRRGYDQGEVRDFLRMVSTELNRLHERELFLERELRDAQSNPDLSTATVDDETLIRLVGEETVRVLAAARESANDIRAKAEQAAARMLGEAGDEAARRREEAEIEASRVRSDAANDAEAEINMAKQQGRDMVNEARAYRERVLSELSRRRELAREQIEQLVAGRDRLMQAFERARIVAVDVVGELQPLGEPDEYVDLSPTTGPVPVMQARTATTAAPSTDAAGTDDADEAEDADRDEHAAVADTGDEAPATDDATETLESDDAVDADAPDDATAIADDTSDGAAADENDAATVEPEAEVATEENVDADDATEVDDAADSLDGADDTTATTDDDTADTDGAADSDVVVDLFARIRSESTPEQQAESAADTTADPGEAVAEIEAEIEASSADAADDTDTTDDDELVEDTEFDQRVADVTPLIVAGARKLKRVLADEQNDVLERLRQKEAVTELADLVADADAHTARYVDAIRDDLLVAANAGAQLSSPGRTAQLSKKQGSAAVNHAAEMLDDWLAGPLRDRLERCIRDGNGDNALVTKKVRAAYREWKTQHIDEHLDDVMLAAHGSGVRDGFEPGTPVRWTPDPQHGSCPDCDDNALGGAVAVGEEFPTGHTFAPAHPGCRCLLIADAP